MKHDFETHVFFHFYYLFDLITVYKSINCNFYNFTYNTTLQGYTTISNLNTTCDYWEKIYTSNMISDDVIITTDIEICDSFECDNIDMWKTKQILIS